MKMFYFIGCDLGTTGTKAGLFDAEGNLLATARQESNLIYGKDGSVVQDPQEMFSSVLETVKQVVAESGVDPKSVGGLALDGQMAGIMGVANDGEPATPYDSWLDFRAAPYAEQMKKKGEELIIRRSGMAPSINHGPKILWWKQEQPAVYQKIAKFTVPSCWVTQKLAGLAGDKTFIDYTYIHFSCFADIKNAKWDEELIELFGLEKEKFPQIVEPWKIVGKLQSPWAEKMGLLPGTPLAAGCGDQAANVLGAGVVDEGIAFDVAGTASCFALNVREYSADVQFKTILFPRSVLADFYYPMAYINGGGMDLEWAKRELFSELATSPRAFAQIDQLVKEKVPEPASIIFIPHLRGRNCPTDPYMRGVFAGFSWDHSREHLFRSILEGIAFEYRYYLKIVRELLPQTEFHQVRVIGGGAKSALWNRIKASVLEIPYAELNRSEFAIWGSALLAAYAAGAVDDLAQKSRQSVEVTKTYFPDDSLSARYRELFPLYLETLQGMGNIFEKFPQLFG